MLLLLFIIIILLLLLLLSGVGSKICAHDPPILNVRSGLMLDLKLVLGTGWGLELRIRLG